MTKLKLSCHKLYAFTHGFTSAVLILRIHLDAKLCLT